VTLTHSEAVAAVLAALRATIRGEALPTPGGDEFDRLSDAIVIVAGAADTWEIGAGALSALVDRIRAELVAMRATLQAQLAAHQSAP